MKRNLLFFIASVVITTASFAENLTLDNKTPYPASAQKSKIAIQWANSAKEVEEENQALMYGSKLKQEAVQVLATPGLINLSIPKKAEYFRVLAWSKGEGDPDFVTNWVDIIPDKTYTLQPDHLVPVVLMLGSGC